MFVRITAETPAYLKTKKYTFKNYAWNISTFKFEFRVNVYENGVNCSLQLQCYSDNFGGGLLESSVSTIV